MGLLSDYEAHLPRAVEIQDDAFRTLDNLLTVIRQTPYRLYLLIDEYDNFANEVLTADRSAYEELVHSDGPFKYLFKWVKAAMGRKGIDRLFITGVSPMVMADVTSGMNVARNVYLKPALADLCGFTDKEVDDLLAAVLAERADYGLTARDAKRMMREWYNGYRFALGVSERVYNPTLVFYFLLHLLEEGSAPDQMLDSNLAADEGKLDYLARVAVGQEAVPDLLEPRRHLGQRADGQDRLSDPAVERYELHHPFRDRAGSQICRSLPAAASGCARVEPLGPAL
jgi:hypothetical protein